MINRVSSETHDSTKMPFTVNAVHFYQFYSSAVLFESVACSRGEFVYNKAGYRSAGKSNCQLRVFMLPALNTVRKLHFYKLAFPF